MGWGHLSHATGTPWHKGKGRDENNREGSSLCQASLQRCAFNQVFRALSLHKPLRQETEAL